MSPTQPSKNIGVVIQDKGGKLKTEISDALKNGPVFMQRPNQPFDEDIEEIKTWRRRDAKLTKRVILLTHCVREALEWLRQGDRSRAVEALERTLPK